MYIESIPDRNSPPAILLRESDRENGKVRKRTLCSVSDWPRPRPPAILGLGEVDEDELYAALDWLGERQPAIETALAKRHLKNGTLVLYDVSSSYMEGSCCSLAHRGYSRDGRKGTLQIVYGLLCAPDGCPVAIEVFDGNTGDPATLAAQ